MKKKLILFVVLFIIFIGIFIIFIKDVKKENLLKINFKGKNIINAEIVQTDEEKAKGLMFRKKLCYDCGMIFIFEDEKVRSFWMKDTLIPLDMIFLSFQKEIVDIIPNTKPCETEECPKYISKKPAKYVIEVNSGYVAEKELMIGDKLDFNER